MNCYIDDFNLVRVESNDYIDTIYLLGEKLQYVATEGYFQYFKSMKEIPLHYADRISINNNEYPLNIGIVTLKERFNERIDKLVKNTSISLVARNTDNEIIGVCFGITDFSYWLFITDLGVRRDCVGCGIGKDLVNKL